MSSTSTRSPRRMASPHEAGPWRTSGDWWDVNVWARDEWDVALTDQTVWRLAHDRLTNHWFLEGVYD